MIHRFTELPASVPTPVVLYQVFDNPGNNAMWMAGNGATPLRLSQTNAAQATWIMGDEALSPNGAELVYCRFDDTSAPHVQDEIVITGSFDGDSLATIAQNPSTSGDHSWSHTRCVWHPDGTQVFYRGENNATQRYAEIRVVDRDGTNNTLLYERHTGGADYMYSFDLDDGVLVNYDGTLLAWWDQNTGSLSTGATAGLWAMNSDGTGAALIAAHSSGGVYGWARTGNQICYSDASGNTLKRTVTAGTPVTAGSATTLGSNASFIPMRYPWTPDDSSLIGRHRNVSGTEPKDAIALLATDGSTTITDLSPQRLVDSVGINLLTHGPYLASDNRLYWSQGDVVQSAELDGSGYLVDHDLTATGDLFYGFFGET